MVKFLTPKRLFLILIISLLAMTANAKNISAALLGPEEGGGGGSIDYYKKALEEPGINLEHFSFFNIDYTGRGITKLLVGYPGHQASGNTPQPSTLYGLTAMNGAMLLYKPASGVEYLADLGRNLGFVKPAFAQKTGFESLNPVKNLWKATRDISYLAFVLIFIVIGFMIMLRTRIDPRTVATVQAAIPGIVVSLILVTFSFAIAGLIIDLVNLSINLVAGFFQQAQVGVGNVQDNVQDIINAFQSPDTNIFTIFPKFLTKAGKAGENIVGQIVQSINWGVLNFIKSIPGTSTIGDMIIGLFFALLIVMLMFRVFLMLLSALVTIILLTIVSPLQFLIAAIPGKGGAVFNWFKSMLTAGLTFPLTFILLLLAAMFLKVNNPPFNFTSTPVSGWDWFPVPLGILCKTETVNGVDVCTRENLMSELIGIGILMFTPKANDLIKSAFDIKPPPWTGAIGETVGGGISALKKVLPI